MKKLIAASLVVLSGCSSMPSDLAINYYKCQSGNAEACTKQYEFNRKAAGDKYALKQQEIDNSKNVMLSCRKYTCVEKS